MMCIFVFSLDSNRVRELKQSWFEAKHWPTHRRFSGALSLFGSLSALWLVSPLCRTWRGLRSNPATPKLRKKRRRKLINKKDYLSFGCLRPSLPLDFTLDLGFIAFHRHGKPRFRPAAPPPDGAERFGSQRRVSDGARRPRLRAAPRSLSAWEILLISPLHGSALRLVVNVILYRGLFTRSVLEHASLERSAGILQTLWDFSPSWGESTVLENSSLIFCFLNFGVHDIAWYLPVKMQRKRLTFTEQWWCTNLRNSEMRNSLKWIHTRIYERSF